MGLFGKSGPQGLPPRAAPLPRDIQLRLSQRVSEGRGISVVPAPTGGGLPRACLELHGATGVPLVTTWDPVAGPGGTPMPGNISGRGGTLGLRGSFTKGPRGGGGFWKGDYGGGVRVGRHFGARWLAL